MTAAATKKIEAFLRRAIHLDTKRTLTRIELLHFVSGSGSSTVDTWAFSEDDPPNEPLVCAEIEARAEGHAEGLPGVQAYRCVAYFGDADRVGMQSDTWRIRSQTNDEDDLFGPTEGPNRAGLVAQSQRHTEGTFRLALGALTQVHQQQAKTIEKQGEMIEKLLGAHVEVLEAAQKMIDRKHDRELERAKQEQELSQQKEVFELFTILAPTVANQMLRKAGLPLALPEKATPIVELLRRVAGTLTPSQMQAFQRVLTPEQFAGFVELYETMAKAEGEKKPPAAAGETKH